ncbi:MAG: hypothetical protein ACLRSW_13430 [Christensenellaceae bacterium]
MSTGSAGRSGYRRVYQRGALPHERMVFSLNMLNLAEVGGVFRATSSIGGWWGSSLAGRR